jgi:hypothetical protein
MPPAFDFFVVGAGGGPDETNLSAYVLTMFNDRLLTLSVVILSNRIQWIGKMEYWPLKQVSGPEIEKTC